MRVLILTVIMALALPFMALGQTAEPQQTQAQPQGQGNETQPAAPAKNMKTRPAQEPGKPEVKPEAGKPETSTNVRGQTDVNVNTGARGVNKTEAETRSSSSTNHTKVSVQEFKSRHSEVFSLGRHPREFFVQRFGVKHFRTIGSNYFVFVDGCWVAVDVDGSVYSERVICAGDPEFIEVVD